MVLDNGNDSDTFTCVKTLFLLNNLYHNLYPSKIRSNVKNWTHTFLCVLTVIHSFSERLLCDHF